MADDAGMPGPGLNVLQVCSSDSWGGMEMHMPILSEQLRARGHEVQAVCPAASPAEADLLARGFEPIHFEGSGYMNIRGILALAKLLRGCRFDIIHAHYSRDLATIVPAMYISNRIPVVFIKHIGTQRPKRDPYHRWLYANTRYLIAISEVIERNIVATHPVRPDQVVRIHHGVDVSKIGGARGERAGVRRELAIPEDALVAGIVGRLQRGKGYFEFLEMARQVSERLPNARFMLVGEPTRGEEKDATHIRQFAAGLQIGDRLVWTGYRRDIPRVLAAMDVFVFPSYAEAFGLGLIEAMAAGLPVVSTNCDGVLDIVEDEQTGLMVPPRDADALASAVLRLLSDPGLRRRLGTAGLLRAKSLFDIQKMVDKVEELYYTCVGSQRAE